MDCNCSTCKNSATCYRELYPTICITRACTQKCMHCCFDCGPDKTKSMSFHTAYNINKFLHANSIKRINISSGEFICHPKWWPALTILVKGIEKVRLISNGDWAASQQASNVLEFLETNPQVKMSISNDRWHTNTNVQIAIRLLALTELHFNVATPEETTPESIVPVGRASGEFMSTAYSMFSRYCTKPNRKYEFLIDEDGKIYKCPFGLWEYDSINRFLDGGFAERFKEFTSTYYKTFISNCTACNRIYNKALHPSVNG